MTKEEILNCGLMDDAYFLKKLKGISTSRGCRDEACDSCPVNTIERFFNNGNVNHGYCNRTIKTILVSDDKISYSKVGEFARIILEYKNGYWRI